METSVGALIRWSWSERDCFLERFTRMVIVWCTLLEVVCIQTQRHLLCLRLAHSYHDGNYQNRAVDILSILGRATLTGCADSTW